VGGSAGINASVCSCYFNTPQSASLEVPSDDLVATAAYRRVALGHCQADASQWAYALGRYAYELIFLAEIYRA